MSDTLDDFTSEQFEKYERLADTGLVLNHAQVAWWEDGCNDEPDARSYPDDDELAIEGARAPESQIESATPEELAARLWGPPVSSEKQAIDLKMRRGMGR